MAHAWWREHGSLFSPLSTCSAALVPGLVGTDSGLSERVLASPRWVELGCLSSLDSAPVE